MVILHTFVYTPAYSSTQVRVSYLYNLANFNGIIPYNDVNVRVDRDRDEVYVVEKGIVRIYNNRGMELFWFGDDPQLYLIYDLAIDKKGDIFLLSYDLISPKGPKYYFIHCNYRGEAKEKISLTGLPPSFSDFFPNRLLYRDGNFFFLDGFKLKAIVADRNGVFLKGYDLTNIFEIPDKDRPNVDIFGFNLDSDGNMLFTVPVLFKAFVVSPDGNMMASFGRAGSAPGMFGIVSAIAQDDHGNYLVVEQLRSVVMIFNKDFQFLHEFGYRGNKPWNLIRPNELAVGESGRIYVTQVRDRGVSVFSLETE